MIKGTVEHMTRKLTLLLIIGLLLSSCAALSAEHPELKAFPAATDGMERFVLTLPLKARGEDAHFKVELIPGKIMLTDGVNQMRHGSSIEARPLTGWGYTYYEVTGQDVAMSTMMAVPEGVQRTEQFVPGTTLMVRYNSRLPIVIYAPVGYEVRYRIWSTTEANEKAEKG